MTATRNDARCPAEIQDPHQSNILPQTFKERVPHLSSRRLRAVLDFGEQLGLDPDALPRAALGVRLRFSDQRRQAPLQVRGHTP